MVVSQQTTNSDPNPEATFSASAIVIKDGEETGPVRLWFGEVY